MSQPIEFNQKTKWYMGIITAAGVIACLITALLFPIELISNPHFIILTIISVVFSYQLIISAPGLKVAVVATECFIYLILIFFDGDAAIIAVTLECLYSTLRHNKNIRLNFFNAAAGCLSIFVAVWVLRLTLGPLTALFVDIQSPRALIGLCLLVVTHAATNILISGLGHAFRKEIPLFRCIFTNFRLVPICYIAGASTAGLFALLINVIGFYIIILAAPLAITINLTYRAYYKNIEATAKAVQAEASREAAMEAARLKSQFLANMSHEIRTPMNAIVGLTGLLLNTSLTTRQHDYVEMLQSSSNSLLSIINDILDFSKIEAGKLDLDDHPFEVRECLEEVLDLFALKVAEKGLNLAYDCDKGVPQEVMGDKIRLRQVLINLINNAIKFTEKGEVYINVAGRLIAEGRYELHFSIRDTGIGIASADIEKLFHSFSQVDGSVTRKHGGTGLGLAISKRLAEVMGGKMWVESELGTGSTFHFTIEAEATPVKTYSYLGDQHPQLRGKRILIVGDNKTQRLILSKQAIAWEMSARSAESWAEALEWTKNGERFDVTLVDLQMPIADGLEFITELSQYPSGCGLPLVISSPIGSQETYNLSQLGNLCAHLNKPLKVSQLYDALLSLSNERATKESQSYIPEHQEVGQRFSPHLPLRILLAEDNVVNQKVATAMLGQLGYQVDVAGNGLEAIEALRLKQYDILLTDMQMPEMGGLEVATRIRQEWAEEDRPRIIALTANAMLRDKERCLEAGMDDYLSKPVRLEQLQEVLSRWGKVQAPQASNAHLWKSESQKDGPSNHGSSAENVVYTAIDLSRLLQLRQMQNDGEPDIVDELACLYLQDAPRRLTALCQALAASNTPAAQKEAHALMGSSLNLGAYQMVSLCEELEDHARRGCGVGGILIEQVEREFARVCHALEAITTQNVSAA